MSEQITGYSVAGVIEADPDNEFVWVKFVACSAAVAAAEQRVRDEFMDSTPELTAYRKQQYAVGVQAARDAVAAHIRADLTGQEMFCGRKRGILAAIDALISGKIGESDE